MGGIGEVYKARDRDRINHVVALKLIDEKIVENGETFERFRSEALLAQTLIHPRIVRLYGLEQTESGRYFLTLEYVEGKSLRDVLDQAAAESNSDPKSGLPFPRAMTIFTQLVEAVAFAHHCNVVHQDLNPSSIFILPKDEVKLLNLGIANRLGEGFDSANLEQILGSPVYVAPEQVRGEPADYRSDVYSLGSIGFELFVGKPPIDAPVSTEELYKQLTQPLPAFAERGVTAPGWFEKIIRKASEKSAEHRFANAGELLDQLDEHTRRVEKHREHDVDPSAMLRQARKRTLALAAAFVFVVGGFLMALYKYQERKTQRIRAHAVATTDTETKPPVIQFATRSLDGQPLSTPVLPTAYPGLVPSPTPAEVGVQTTPTALGFPLPALSTTLSKPPVETPAAAAPTATPSPTAVGSASQTNGNPSGPPSTEPPADLAIASTPSVPTSSMAQIPAAPATPVPIASLPITPILATPESSPTTSPEVTPGVIPIPPPTEQPASENQLPEGTNETLPVQNSSPTSSMAEAPTTTPAATNQIVAELVLRETDDPSPNTTFALSRVTELRWVATLKGLPAHLITRDVIAREASLLRINLDVPGEFEILPATLLFIDMAQQSIRIGGSLGKQTDGKYQPGSFQIALQFRGKRVAVLPFTITP